MLLLTTSCVKVKPVTVPVLPDLEAHFRLFLSIPQPDTDYIVSGDSHTWAMGPLLQYTLTQARTVGFTKRLPFTTLMGLTTCDETACWIAIDAKLPPNAMVSTIFHELAHVKYALSKQERLPRPESEVLAETVAYLACQQIGLNTRLESFAYLTQVSDEDRSKVWKTKGTMIAAWAKEFADATLKGKK